MRPYERIATRNAAHRAVTQQPISRTEVGIACASLAAALGIALAPIAWVVAYLAGWV